MQVNPQMMNYQGMQIPIPVLNVNLHVLSDFTGRVVLYIKKRSCDMRPPTAR